MEELINFLIEVANYFKYGKIANRNRSFEKELAKAEHITDSKANKPKEIVTKQLSDLKKKGDGIPTFAYFKRKKQDWYELIILNERKKFYCRLGITQVTTNEILPNRFFFFI